MNAKTQNTYYNIETRNGNISLQNRVLPEHDDGVFICGEEI